MILDTNALLAFIDGDHRFDPGFVDFFFVHRLLKPGGLVVVDLNGFKKINDTHGHAAGDALLKDFAKAGLTALPQTPASEPVSDPATRDMVVAACHRAGVAPRRRRASRHAAEIAQRRGRRRAPRHAGEIVRR